jgi:hypothetical protein
VRRSDPCPDDPALVLGDDRRDGRLGQGPLEEVEALTEVAATEEVGRFLGIAADHRPDRLARHSSVA